MAEDAGLLRVLVVPGDLVNCGASDLVEEDVAVALEDDDGIFGTELLSVMPDSDRAEKSTAKRPCVSKDWGEAAEEEETAGTADKGGAASDGKTKIQMPATLQ